jgi:peptide-methionine (R)-S-oxide reductase
MRTTFIVAAIVLLLAGLWFWFRPGGTEQEGVPPGGKISRSEDEWRRRLTAEQYHVLRQGGTEPAFSGSYWNCKDDGVYLCAGCEQPLFDSTAKFDSGTGWPSFFQPLEANAVSLRSDRSHFMVRTEVRCSRCDGHLGHVFNDGPAPTGKRYCMNSAALRLVRRSEAAADSGGSKRQ